jgi:hypothetical protein
MRRNRSTDCSWCEAVTLALLLVGIYLAATLASIAM